MRDIRIHSFDPVCDDKSRILILGTMPGKLSLLHYEYYANPGNCFWDIMSRIFGKEPVVDYYEKKKLLLKTGFMNQIKYIKLPSTSPANARMSREDKYLVWNEALKSFVIDIRE